MDTLVDYAYPPVGCVCKCENFVSPPPRLLWVRYCWTSNNRACGIIQHGRFVSHTQEWHPTTAYTQVYWQLWRRVYTTKVAPPRGTVIGQSSSEFIQKVTLARGTAIGQSSSNDKYLTTLCSIISILPFWSNKYETLKYEHSVRTDKPVE